MIVVKFIHRDESDESCVCENMVTDREFTVDHYEIDHNKRLLYFPSWRGKDMHCITYKNLYKSVYNGIITIEIEPEETDDDEV